MCYNKEALQLNDSNIANKILQPKINQKTTDDSHTKTTPTIPA
jgi:hypothetical protein